MEKDIIHLIKKMLKIFIFLLFFFGLTFSSYQYLQLKKVDAKEIIKKSLEKILEKGTIYHHKASYFRFSKESDKNEDTPIIYEIWEDQDSNRFKNQVIYKEGKKVIQVFDGNILWDYNEEEKTLKKDIYLYPDPKEKETKRGERIDLIKTYRDLLDKGILKGYEGEINGRKVWQIIDEQTKYSSSYWNVFYFNKDNFMLLQQEKWEEKDGKKLIREKIVYEIMEIIPKQSTNISKIFLFDNPLSENTKVFERHFNISTGYIEDDYYLASSSSKFSPSVSPLAPTIINNLIDNWKTYKDEKYSFELRYYPGLTPYFTEGKSEDIFLKEILFGTGLGGYNYIKSPYGFRITVYNNLSFDVLKNKIIGHVTDKIDSEINTEVNGVKWKRFNYNVFSTTDFVSQTTAISTYQGLTYEITALTDNIDIIVSTFRFLD